VGTDGRAYFTRGIFFGGQGVNRTLDTKIFSPDPRALNVLEQAVQANGEQTSKWENRRFRPQAVT
jgi:hypothetical protein